MKALVYLRISQDRSGLAAGVTRQREDCLKRCDERGWTVVATENDNDQSATTGRRRPGFEAMLTAVDVGTAEVVVAWSLDRLQRNRRDEVRLYELCRDRGAILSLVNGADLDFATAAGRFVADSLGSVARLEVEMKSDRQIRAVAQAAQAGRRVGGRKPFGYEQDGNTVVPIEARAILDGYGAILAGAPLAEVARMWNKRGLFTGQARRKGEHKGDPSPWRADSVRSVLLNPRNAGHRALRGEIVAPAEWPALVDEGTYEAVREVLTDPGRRRKPTRGQSMLTGLAICGKCGKHTVHAGGGNGGTHNYRCRGGACFARRSEPVDEFVSAVVIERLSRAEANELLEDKTVVDIDALRAEAQAIRARLNALATDFADGVLTATQLRTATERARANLADVEAQMADAGRVDVLGPLISAADVADYWERMSNARRRAVIALLCEVRIMPAGRGTREFNPESVKIIWRST